MPKAISAKIDDELMSLVDNRITQDGINKNQLITAALESYLNPDPTSAMPEDVSSVLGRLATVLESIDFASKDYEADSTDLQSLERRFTLLVHCLARMRAIGEAQAQSLIG